MAEVGVVVQVDEVHPDGPLDGQEPLGGDAHHQVCLAAQQDCLCWVPKVGEQLDVQLVVQVEVRVEAVDDDHDDKEKVDNGEGDDGLMEVGVDAGASEDNTCEKVPENANSPHRGNAHLRWSEGRILMLESDSSFKIGRIQLIELKTCFSTQAGLLLYFGTTVEKDCLLLGFGFDLVVDLV